VKVGILGDEFYLWNGGIDFISTIASALEATKKVDTYLIIGVDKPIYYVCRSIKRFVLKNKFKVSKFMADKKETKKYLDMINETFNCCCPKTKIIYYRYGHKSKEKDLQKCLIKLGISICLPVNGLLSSSFKVPWIGYLYDFQHRYIPNLFSEEEIENRNIYFEKVVNNAEYVLVNAKAVEKDIIRFYPDYKCKIITLPFLPFQIPCDDLEKSVERYQLPDKYFIISNQFWAHKSHITAFKALNELYKQGYRDIHLICTGENKDTRNDKYGSYINSELEKLECKDNIHIIGFIPKSDQIIIMSGAIALIQPTLFEGGPGGGSVYNALCLGVPCLVSDIDVNREIIGYDTVYFFKAKDFIDLSELMLSHISDAKTSLSEVLQIANSNKVLYGDYLLDKINQIIN